MRRNGFSLIELIVVILIISILTVLAGGKIAEVISSTRARLAANELAVNLRYIRNLAMDREVTVRAIFASNSYAVAISDTNAPDGYSAAQDPVTLASWTNMISRRFPGVAIADVNIGNGNAVYFSATNGIPLINTNGDRLTSTGSITFDSGLTVTISPETGYINIE